MTWRTAALAIIGVALAGSAAQAARTTIGVHGRWAAFRDDAPRRCFAITRPVRGRRGGADPAFLSVATWPGAGLAGQLHVRLGRPVDARARVVLTVGERRFALIAGARDAWAPDAATDRAIIQAMRAARSASVESVAASGGGFAEVYSLAGAATAIDAAALACAAQ